MLIGLTSKSGYIETFNMFYWEIGFLFPIVIMLFIFSEWIGRDGQYAISHIGHSWYRPLRWCFFSLIIFIIGMFMASSESQFIYFQF